MSVLTLFIIEVLICLLISLVVIYLLTPVLRNVLTDGCGTAARAEFWVTFTQLMLVVSPLLLVIYFAPTGAAVHPNLAEAIQDTLFLSLLGDFVALSMIGKVMWRSVTSDLAAEANHEAVDVDSDVSDAVSS